MLFKLETYIQKYQPKQVQRDEYVIKCPICQREKLTVNVSKNLWHCWVCQEYGYRQGKRVPIKGAGNALQLVSLLEGCTIHDAKKIIVDSTVRFIPKSGKRNIDFEAIPYPAFSKMVSYALPFCIKRGITLEDCTSFGLFYCDGGRLKNRLIFPVYHEGKLVFYQGRAMWDPIPGSTYIKSINSGNTENGAGAEDVLFNLDKAKHWDRVAVVEGPIDAIHTGISAVATWGKHITDKQIMLLYRSGVRAVDLMWDGPTRLEPNGAYPEMISAVPRLSGIFDVRVIFLPEGDPGDYNREDLNYFRNNRYIKAKDVSRLTSIRLN